MEISPRPGDRLKTEASKGRWPRRVISWLGFEADTDAVRGKLTPRKQEKGKAFTLRWATLPSETAAPAAGALHSASYLNFPEWPAPGGSCSLRSGWAPSSVRAPWGSVDSGHVLPTVAS